MRKAVRQAKVHVVRKLTREVAKLKDRKGTEEIKQKCQRKAERLHQEIISIKVTYILKQFCRVSDWYLAESVV